MKGIKLPLIEINEECHSSFIINLITGKGVCISFIDFSTAVSDTENPIITESSILYDYKC